MRPKQLELDMEQQTGSKQEKEFVKAVYKTRDLFKKFRDNKGTNHAKMGSIKDRNGMI